MVYQSAICVLKDFGQAVLGMDMYHIIIHTYPHGHTMYSPVLSRHIVFIYEKGAPSRFTGDGLMSFPCVHATHVRLFGINLLVSFEYQFLHHIWTRMANPVVP